MRDKLLENLTEVVRHLLKEQTCATLNKKHQPLSAFYWPLKLFYLNWGPFISWKLGGRGEKKGEFDGI